MKAKKAMRRLDKADAILSDVIDQYAENGSGSREFLDAARISIVHAKAEVNKTLNPASRKESPKKTKDRKPSSKKSSGAKRKGVQTETAQRSDGPQQSKTA